MAVRPSFARFRVAAWLGWQVDSNWADPILFVIYAVARPLAVALILVAMYWAVSGHAVHSTAFTGFYLANAFHSYVNSVVVDLGWVVFSEREEYEMLKYIAASPMGLNTFLLGRAVIKFGRATISVLLVLALGWFALGLRWGNAAAHPAALAATLALGLAATLAGAMLMAGACLVLTRAAMIVLDGVTLSLYLLCGVIFPVDLLPVPLRVVSFTLPWTWWYEALRRLLTGVSASASMGKLSDAQLVGGLAVTTVVFSGVAALLFRWLQDRARALGRLDQTTLF